MQLAPAVQQSAAVEQRSPSRLQEVGTDEQESAPASPEALQKPPQHSEPSPHA
jgi:hypothetical protein